MYVESVSTRLTYKHLDLAHRALTDLMRDQHTMPSQPTLALTDLCLKLSSDLLDRKSAMPRGVLAQQIIELLSRVAAADPRIEQRTGLAFATLHFVERTLGFTMKRNEGQQKGLLSCDKARERGQNCGTYGTPEFIANTMVKETLEALGQGRTESVNILDMSVEAGQYPLTFLCQLNNSFRVQFHAIDQDPAALETAKRILRFVRSGNGGKHFGFRVSCRNSLLSPVPGSWPGQFSAIVGNPPWKELTGECARRIQDRHSRWLSTGRFDIYLAFIARADSLLAPGGYLSYVVPSTFLFNCGATANVRRLLLEGYDILRLTLYPQRSFIELPCVIPISFLARKRHSASERHFTTTINYHPTSLGGNARPRISSTVNGASLWKVLPGHVFHPCASRSNQFLCTDLPGESLSYWGQLLGGAHLGSARKQKPPLDFKGIHARHIRPFHVCSRQVPVYSKDIPRFERPPEASWVRANKVIIQELRYMTHRERLIAARAGPGCCAVSTAMMFFPSDEKYCDFFAAILNSQLANAWYKLRDVSRSIKLKHLREFPVPFDVEYWKRICELARACRDMRTEFHKKLSRCTVNDEDEFLRKRFGDEFCAFEKSRNRIEEAVFELYDLPASHRQAVRRLSEARVF